MFTYFVSFGRIRRKDLFLLLLNMYEFAGNLIINSSLIKQYENLKEILCLQVLHRHYVVQLR